MLVLAYKDGDIVGKMFQTTYGYYYKIYYTGGKKGGTVIAQSYVNLFDKGLCMERMITEMQGIDLQLVAKLK